MSLYPRLFQNQINESPDNVKLPNNTMLTWEDKNAFAFGYYNGNIYMSPKSKGHGSMGPKEKRKTTRFSRSEFQFAGRIWKKEKIMSFWDYPEKKEFQRLLRDISNITDIHFNTSWKVELSDGKIIPIDEYESSDSRSEEDLAKQHVLSPLLKKKREIIGWGSKHPKYLKRRQWAMADLAHESFYPRINEADSKLYSKGSGNTFLLRELVAKYPDKYKYSTGIRIENISKISNEEFMKDIKEIIDQYDLDADKNTIKMVGPGQSGSISGKYDTLNFTLDDKFYKVKYSGIGTGAQMTQTPTVFKEGLVVYFFQTDEVYEPFKKTTKDKEVNYHETIDRMITDIKSNGIEGMDKKDVNYILRTLEQEGVEWNVDFAGSIFNAMSIGNKLKQTQFSDWEIYRDKFFNDIKKEAAQGIGFAANAVDKWNPMDIMLVKPGKKQAILDRWAIAAEKNENDVTKLGDYNNTFADDLETNNENILALAISLKEQTSQGGKGKSYISRVEKVSDRYNLTKDEQGWEQSKLMDEILKQRKRTPELIANLKEADLFNYRLEGTPEGFNILEATKAKYGSLKMLNYLLEKVPEDNMFISLAAYSLSLGQNPAFFKFQGARDGNPDNVHIYKFPQEGGVTLYDRVHEDYDGKITIRDGNNNAGIEIKYYIVTAEILYSVKLQIRSGQGTRRNDKDIQVNIEIQKISEIKDLAEGQSLSFYPRLNEKFTEESDPIEDLGIGAFQMNVEMKGDFKGSEIHEKKKAKNWIYKDIQALKVEGTIDTERVYIDIDLTNNDHIYFEDFYLVGLPGRGLNDYAHIQSKIIGKENVTEEFIDNLEQYGGIILSVLKTYEQLLSGKRKKPLDEKFSEESDPIEDLGIGLISQFIKAVKRDTHDIDVEHAYSQTIRRFHKKYPQIDWIKVFNELTEYTYMNEAFTDDESDPIADMGIGGFSYETLKPGAILKPKRMGIAVTKNKSGQFTSWNTGLCLIPDSFILIYKVIRYGENHKDIYFKKYGWGHHTEEFMYKAVNDERKSLNQRNIPWGGSSGRMIVSKKKFDYRFEIIEKGFE